MAQSAGRLLPPAPPPSPSPPSPPPDAALFPAAVHSIRSLLLSAILSKYFRTRNTLSLCICSGVILLLFSSRWDVMAASETRRRPSSTADRYMSRCISSISRPCRKTRSDVSAHTAGSSAAAPSASTDLDTLTSSSVTFPSISSPFPSSKNPRGRCWIKSLRVSMGNSFTAPTYGLSVSPSLPSASFPPPALFNANRRTCK
mmetsp:Transcript_59802/g.177232  ORF Transcript_59802/g.177232 Transcript_59802/m.177232 type:complete len:201 (+) Transcript_59802:542-1144(+)